MSGMKRRIKRTGENTGKTRKVTAFHSRTPELLDHTEWNARMQDLKRRSLEAKAKTGNGRVKPTTEDREAALYAVRKLGRPKKIVSNLRSESIPVRWTPEEAKKLRECALRLGMSPSEYVRSVVGQILNDVG